jgi:hypothetical protein
MPTQRSGSLKRNDQARFEATQNDGPSAIAAIADLDGPTPPFTEAGLFCHCAIVLARVGEVLFAADGLLSPEIVHGSGSGSCGEPPRQGTKGERLGLDPAVVLLERVPLPN